MKKIFIPLFACWAALQLLAADTKVVSPKVEEKTDTTSSESKSEPKENLNWQTDLTKAQAEAKKENKLVFMEFTGSDWCGWCIKQHHETYSKPEFAEYAKKNLVLVEVDFPAQKEQPEPLKATNKELLKKYDPEEALPAIVLMKPDGTVLWTKQGFVADGPKGMIEQIEKAKPKS
jgi:uncharacterized protein YyaL (SSP411 family)